MAIKRYKPEQIVTLLRQIEVGIANGKPAPQACNEAGITVQIPLAERVWRAEVRAGEASEGFMPHRYCTEYSTLNLQLPKSA